MSLRLPAELYAKLKRVVLDRDGWKCRFCRIRNGLHAHHIIYRSHGGEDTTANLMTLCHTCHDAVHSLRLRLSPNNGDLVDANLPITFARVGGWRPKR